MRAEVHYSHAMELYRRVLEKDEGEPAGRAGNRLRCWRCCPQLLPCVLRARRALLCKTRFAALQLILGLCHCFVTAHTLCATLALPP